MRVLHVLPTRSREYGGPVTVAEQMVKELNRLGIDASLFPEDDNNSRHPYSINTWTTLLQAVTMNDIIHIHGLWNFSATLAAYAARRRGIPYVITPHGMLAKWALQRSYLKKMVYSILFERRNLRKAAIIHLLNNEELAEAQEFESDCKTLVLPNGVHPGLFRSQPEHTAFLRQHPECTDRVVALFLGRLHPKKGLDLLLPAFAHTLQQVPKLHLMIAGPDQGGYRQKLEAEVKRLNINERVTFTGMVQGETKKKLLAAADFFILTSYQEGDSMAVKEAMAAGLPVIITTSCHFNEVEREGAGFVVSHNPETISQAIATLIMKSDRKEMGAKAAQLIKEKYTWPIIVNRLISTYKHLLNKMQATNSIS